jgi:hypothetical protein
VHKASTTRETAEFGNLKHVNLTLLRMVDKTTFLSDLLESLSYYGKVLQVKQFTSAGYFEGKLSVILDTSVGFQVGDEWQAAKPLDRMIYLSEFDCFVPATYRGAPPVCHFCQHSGHVRAKCPELARRKCFGCNKQGHMIKFCPEKKHPEYVKKQKVVHQSEDSEEVKQARQATKEVMDLMDKEKIGAGNEEKSGSEDEELASLVDEDESLQGDDDSVDTSANGKSTKDMEDLQAEDHQVKYTVDDDMEDDEVVLAGAVKKLDSVRSSAYSKYASTEVALTMNVDSPEEMMGLSKLKETSQRKRLEFNAQLKGGNGTGLKAYSGGDSSVSGTGSKSVKAGVSVSGSGSGSGGVKTSNKNDGKLPSKTKQNARRAQ